jgi:tetratricopeptide (TPR) repeat protein
LAKLSVDQALLKAKSHAKKGEIGEAQKLYQAVLQAFPKNKRAQQGLTALNKPKQPATTQGPPQEVINQLINLYNQGQLKAVVEQAQGLKQQYPEAFIIWNILGAANKGLGRVQIASEAFKKVTELNPTYAAGFNNLGVTLQEQDKLEEAIEAYNKALAIKPDYAEAYNNLGVTLKDQGKLEKAIEAYNKALTIKPDYADAHKNMGDALEKINEKPQALKAFKSAIKYNEHYKNLFWSKFFNLQRGSVEPIVKKNLDKESSALPGNPTWLIKQEKKYGGVVQGVRRNNLSSQENESSFQLVHGHTGGDRMDFGPKCHGYSVLYCHAINSYLNNVSKKATDPSLKIAEIGILNGSGLAIWSDWFENAELFGFDIDLAIFNSNRQFLLGQGAFQKRPPRLSTLDQYTITADEILEFVQGTKINIAIDDGAHTELSIIKTFSAFKPILENDFLYFIEDNWNTISFLQPLFSDIKIKQFGDMAIVFPKHLNLLDKLESIDDMMVLLGLDPMKFWK